MATSSIFHNVIMTDPDKVEAFVDAIEASVADPYIRPEGPVTRVNTDPELSKRLAELRRKAREKK